MTEKPKPGTARTTREQRRRQREHEAHTVVHDMQTVRRRGDNRTGLIVLAVVAVLAVGSQFAFAMSGGFAPSDEAPTPTTELAEATPTQPANPVATADPNIPSPDIAEDREWTGNLSFNDGALKLGISIDGVKAPQAAANFIKLSQDDFFDDTQCHRLTTEGLYVLQCGDPTATGTGGPGYEFGPLENVPTDGVYPAGTIAMARAQAEDSMGSQFFIVYRDSQLPAPGYTVFGKVTSGMDELKTKIVDVGVEAGATDGKPAAPATISDVTLE